MHRDKTWHWHASHIQTEDSVDRLLRSTDDVTRAIFGNHISLCGFKASRLTDCRIEADSASAPFNSDTLNVPITLHKLINPESLGSPLDLVWGNDHKLTLAHIL